MLRRNYMITKPSVSTISALQCSLALYTKIKKGLYPNYVPKCSHKRKFLQGKPSSNLTSQFYGTATWPKFTDWKQKGAVRGIEASPATGPRPWIAWSEKRNNPAVDRHRDLPAWIALRSRIAAPITSPLQSPLHRATTSPVTATLALTQSRMQPL